MNFFPDLIRSNIPFIVLLLLGTVAFVAAWRLYRQTVPAISNPKKYVLGGLRLMVVFLVILLFFMPRLFVIFQTEKKERTAVFIDNSLSMKMADEGLSRWQRAERIASRLSSFSDEPESWERYVFNSDVRKAAADSLRLSQGGTNFEKLLDFVKNKGLQKVFIISDGNYTEGAYPFSAKHYLNTKIFTIGVGRESGPGDVFISDVQYPRFAYRGKESKIRVELGSSNVQARQSLRLKLMHGGKLLSAKRVSLGQNNTRKKIYLNYTPQSRGLKRLTVRLDSLDDESNTLNNAYSIIQEVLKSKINIALFSGQAGYEIKFIRFLLNRENDFISRLYVEDSRGKLIGRPKAIPWDSLDVLILQDYPGAHSPKDRLNKISSLLRSGKAGALFYFGKTPVPAAAEAFSDFWPFASRPVSAQPLLSQHYQPGKGAAFEILNLFDDLALNERFWQIIPPLQFHFKAPRLKKEARVLLECNPGNARYPVLISRRKKGHRVYALLGRGFWKWHFLLQDEPELQPGYNILLKEIVRMLANRSALKRVALEAERKSAHPGEAVHLKVNLYDAEFQKIKDGEVVLQVRSKQEKFELPAERDSSGRFEAVFIPAQAGRYVIQSGGYRNGDFVGLDSVALEVIPLEKEFLHSGQNSAFLKRLAALGNGFYVPQAELDSLRKVAKTEIRKIYKEKDIELWYQPSLLLLIIVIISLE